MMLEANGEPAAQTSGELCRLADECWAQDRSRAALEAAWAAFDLAPNNRATKVLLARLLRDYPDELQPDRRAAYLKLITDRDIEPYFISSAGWRLLLGSRRLAEDAAEADFESLITDLQHDELAPSRAWTTPDSNAPPLGFGTCTFSDSISMTLPV